MQLYRFNCDVGSAREKPAPALLGQARLARRHAREALEFAALAPIRPAPIISVLARRLALAMLSLVGLLSVPGIGGAEEKTFSLTAENRRVDIGSGMTYDAMTYDGTVPGPVLRVRQCDDVTIELTNQTTDAHGINIYAAQIDPKLFGETSTKKTRYQFRADVPGVFDYHCSAFPVLDQVAGGMYGMMIVEPKDG